MEKTSIECDKGLANQLHHVIDDCNFSVVKRYVLDPESEIEFAVLVPKRYHLHEVAATLLRTPSEAFDAFCSLEGLWLAKPFVLPGRFDVLIHVLRDSHRCDVLYAPPAYFVQFKDVDDLAAMLVNAEAAFLDGYFEQD